MNVFIVTPLEPELVERIWQAVGADGTAGTHRIASDVAAGGHRVIYEADLLPQPRYPSDHRGRDGYVRDAAAQARWKAHLAEADVMLGIPGESSDQLAEAIALAPRLRWVQCMYAGAGEQVRNANLSAVDLARVTFTTSAGVHGTTLAEFFFMGLLALRKDIRRLERLRAERRWDHWAMDELRGSTLAIVGMGAIGHAVAKLARAFGMRVIAVTRDGTAREDPDGNGRDNGGAARENGGGASCEHVDLAFSTSRLTETVAQADAVLLTLPGTESTAGLFGREAISAMKPTTIFGNVGRGTVVDQEALIAALQSRKIAGAVLDVFTPEPLPPDNPLWTMENVIFSPHTAALSVWENARIVDIFCENLQRLSSGKPLRNVVNLSEFY